MQGERRDAEAASLPLYAPYVALHPCPPSSDVIAHHRCFNDGRHCPLLARTHTHRGAVVRSRVTTNAAAPQGMDTPVVEALGSGNVSVRWEAPDAPNAPLLQYHLEARQAEVCRVPCPWLRTTPPFYRLLSAFVMHHLSNGSVHQCCSRSCWRPSNCPWQPWTPCPTFIAD